MELDAGGIQRIFYLPVVNLNKTGSERKYILRLHVDGENFESAASGIGRK